MSYDIWIVVAIIVFALIGFAFEVVRSDLVAIVVMCLLIVTGILTPTEATSGFSNPATITVACMFIISAAFVNAGLVEFSESLFSKQKKLNSNIAVFLLMLVVGTISAFVNNTAAVAVFIPIAIKMAENSNSGRKRFLMPLSFAAIFGGTCTLIGTSTNILVNSIYVSRGYSGFGMFEFASLGALLAFVGMIYMMTVGRWLLGDDGSENSNISSRPHEYLTEVMLKADSPSVGMPLKESPFYKDFSDNIVSMKRNSNPGVLDLNPILEKEDKILLVCDVERIISLQKRIGISILDSKFGAKDLPKGMKIHEVVVPSNSELVGEQLTYGGRIRALGIIPLAIRHRQRTLFNFMKRTQIHAGDVMIVAAKPETFEDFRNEEHLLVLSRPSAGNVNWVKMGFSTFLIVSLVSLSSLGIITVLSGVVFVLAILLLTKTLSLKEAYAALDAQVLILLACILSLGLALDKSGGATAIADLFLRHGGTFGPYFVVSALYLATSLLTEVMSNNATAALMAPVALNVATAMNLESKPFVLAVMMAGSASFMTPVGYQTNTLVFAPGGYKFVDFLKVGTPLNIIFWILCTFLIPVFFPFQ